jgi:hypothetical protein
MFNNEEKYHKSDTFTFSQLKERLVVDGQVWIVEAIQETFKGWGNGLNTFYSKFATGTIFKKHIFSCNSSAPTTLSTKKWRDAETDKKKKLHQEGNWRVGLCPADETVQIGTAHGTGSTRDKASRTLEQVEKVYPSWIPRSDLPEPDEEMIQRIKNEKKEKLKQSAAKKKNIGQPPAIVATESELVLESVYL